MKDTAESLLQKLVTSMRREALKGSLHTYCSCIHIMWMFTRKRTARKDTLDFFFFFLILRKTFDLTTLITEISLHENKDLVIVPDCQHHLCSFTFS